ncbi:MAG TPA: hypothetical protein VM639_24315 [Dongiaceae bacterium]|nr:hypothetical protein [Dongiaceae bacterium]
MGQAARAIQEPVTQLSQLGERPQLVWLPIGKLETDPSYQRSMAGRVSQKLIRHIALNFTWSRFQVLTVTAKPGEGWTVPGWLIIDGQHRAAAALLRGDIAELPCIILDLPDRAAQAQAFVALNRDRVAINRLQMHHAAAAAGDPASIQLNEICAAAGIEIPRNIVPKGILKAHQTMAVSTLQRILREQGAETIQGALKLTRLAWPSRPCPADLIDSIAFFISNQHGEFDLDHLLMILKLRMPDSWLEISRRRKYEDNCKITRAVTLSIMATYNAKAPANLAKLKLEVANAGA